MERILVISDVSAPLSPTSDAPRIVDSLRRRGCVVEVVALQRDPGNTWFPGATVIPWPRRVSWSAWQGIRQAIRKMAPGQIYVWGDAGDTVAPVVAALARCEVKQVVGSAARSARRTRLPIVHKRSSQRVVEVVRHPDLVPILSAREPQRGSGVAVLPWFANGIASPVDRAEIRRRLGVPAGAALVGTVAPLVPRARLKDFIWAGDLLRCVRDDVWWIIIGSGPQEWRLKRFASQLEVHDRVRLVGWRQDAGEIVAALDLYVQPSDAFDDYSGLRAAMSCGVPAIGVSRSLHQELVVHHGTGFLAERGARNEIARCVNRLLNEPAIRAALGQGARQHAKRALVSADEAAQALLAAGTSQVFAGTTSGRVAQSNG
jgi:glycosyltransferase involved in cell wall biosynthesis